MRWVDRGAEPSSVAGYARQFTQGWIDYFQNGIGGRPPDSYWRELRPTLGSRTNNICWYCERKCYADAEYGELAATVDHFRPLSRFPQLAYGWDNWVFSCQRCNGSELGKGDNWPQSGYVDPSAAAVSERPEQYFDYDAATGEIVAKSGLSETARRRAQGTINDLGLNRLDVMFYRFLSTLDFVDKLLSHPVSERQGFIESMLVDEYGGTNAKVLEQLRRDGYV